MKLVCPGCQNKVECVPFDDPDLIVCPYCNIDLKLDYVGDLLNTLYFLVERFR